MSQVIVDADYFFAKAGNIIALDQWLPENVIDQIDALNADQSKHLRWREENDNLDGNDDHAGNKGGVEYNHVPTGWGLPDHASTVSCLTYDKGDMLAPHRDKWKSTARRIDANGYIKPNNGMRLINFANATKSTEFHFVVDGEIFQPEPRRWYAINTQLVHYGFSFVDNVYHVTADITFKKDHRMESINYLLDNMEYSQDPMDRKGVDCSRN
jgi:hypothetical protein